MGILSGYSKSGGKSINRINGSAYSFIVGSLTSGRKVNERSATQMTAVYSYVRILSEAVASLFYGCKYGLMNRVYECAYNKKLKNKVLLQDYLINKQLPKYFSSCLNAIKANYIKCVKKKDIIQPYKPMNIPLFFLL